MLGVLCVYCVSSSSHGPDGCLGTENCVYWPMVLGIILAIDVPMCARVYVDAVVFFNSNRSKF